METELKFVNEGAQVPGSCPRAEFNIDDLLETSLYLGGFCSEAPTPVFDTPPAHNIPIIPPLYSMYDNPGSEVKVDVQLLDLKPCYEKGQSRRKANSEQRLLDAEVHMVAEFERPLQALYVYVERVPSAARFLQDNTGRVPLQVIWGTRDQNRIKLSVDLDSVYETSKGTKVYELSRVKGEERNVFRIVVVLVFVDGNTKEFVSKLFQVRSRRTPKGTSIEEENRIEVESSTSEDGGYCSTPEGNKKRKRTDCMLMVASPDGSVSSGIVSESGTVIADHLEANSAYIEELRVGKPILTQRGDIAYHFRVKKSLCRGELEEGDVVGFFQDNNGNPAIERLNHTNASTARMAGVISRSAYLEARAPADNTEQELSDKVCVIGMVDVKMMGPVQNGERVYVSLENPGLAVPESRLGSNRDRQQALLGQCMKSVDCEIHEVNKVQCFVSVLLGISSNHTVQAMRELREDVKIDMRNEFEQRKKRCLSGCVVKAIIALIVCVLLGALFYQLYVPGSKYNYWKCRKESEDGHDFWFTFTTADKQIAPVHGIEFTWANLKEKLSLNFDKMNTTDAHYYLNLDRCAYGGIRHVASPIDGTPMVRGAEVFAVDHNCTVVYYHSAAWTAYSSARNIKCNSHP